MMAGCIAAWLSLPKLFRVMAAVIRRSGYMPNEELLMRSCLRAYFRLSFQVPRALSPADASGRELEQRNAAGAEIESRRPHGHGKRAGARHARGHVDFEEMHSARTVHDEIGTRDVAQPERRVGGDRDLGRLLADRVRQPSRNVELALARRVASGVVVGAAWRDDLDGGERSWPLAEVDDADSYLGTRNKAFDQRRVSVPETSDNGGREIRRAVRRGRPERGNRRGTA